MARPLKTGLDYFPHDCDSSSDEKLGALRSLHGNDGFAFYFISLERIYRNENCELDLSDHEAVVILAKKVGVPVRRLKRILKAALKLKCFDAEAYNQRKVLTSSGIKKRAQVILDERERKRKNYKSKPDKGSRAVMDGETPGEMGGETPQIKVKESILIELCRRVLYRVREESGIYAVVEKFRKLLTVERLMEILSGCIGRNRKFADEHRLAAYLQACAKNNGSVRGEELREITGDKPGWMDG